MTDNRQTLHANAIAVAGEGVLIIGPSGSGKSALALQMIALGADLIADDRTIVRRQDGRLIASAPDSIAGLIEARGIGILQVPYGAASKIRIVVDLSQVEDARLPPLRSIALLDIRLPCLHKVDAPYFPAAIHAYLRGTILESK